MDARQERTRAALSRAILGLARSKPVTTITVSEVAAAAGINRSTFYEHSDSPAALLRSTLRTELDGVRDRNLSGPLDARSAVSSVTSDVLDHVDSHSAIYSRGLGLGDNAGELHSMLSAHFQQSVHQLFATGTVSPPGDDSDYLRDTVARFVADGTVGAIEVWLRMPQPRDRAEFLSAYRVVMPSWWPLG
jgi:AcrR family transcriptional regulator